MSLPFPPPPPRPDTPAVSETDTAGRPRSTWGWWEGFGVYLLAFVAGSVVTIPVLAALGPTAVGGAIGPTEILATILADIVIFGVLLVWLSRWHGEWRGSMVLPSRDRTPRDLLFGAIAGAILVPAVGLVSGALALILRAASGRSVSTPEQIAPGLSPRGAVLLVVLAVVVAPISEELFWRGVLFRTVRDRHGFWPAALASAVPFGIIHWLPAPWLDALLLQTTMIATGVGFAWVYERRGRLAAPIAAHMAFNAIGVVTILAIVR